MSTVINDRFTTRIDQPFVVFLVGMRVNRFTRFRKWLSVFNAFPKMKQLLDEQPERGFMGGEVFFRLFPLTTIMVSYWRSFNDLERFARQPGDPHAEAWQKFNHEIGYDGSVGVWHETYLVEPGRYENLYGNMPLFGLAKATQNVVPIHGGAFRNARGRLKGNEAAVAPELDIYEKV